MYVIEAFVQPRYTEDESRPILFYGNQGDKSRPIFNDGNQVMRVGLYLTMVIRRWVYDILHHGN